MTASSRGESRFQPDSNCLESPALQSGEKSMLPHDVTPMTSRPYKSRLFNALNHQRLVWSDRTRQTLRSLKIGGIWGLQILLYPFYLLAQTGRSLVWKLEQAVSPPSLPAQQPEQAQTPPASDTPIQHTLKALVGDNEAGGQGGKGAGEQGDKGELNDSPSPITHHPSPIPPIQGVASCVETRQLVLVTPENEPVSLLTPEQQKQLQKRILWELSDYHYQNYQLKVSSQRFLIPEPPEAKVLPPVRLFWKTMRWVQQSPIALTTNVFGESQLLSVVSPAPVTVPEPTLPFIPPLPEIDALYKLDAAIAQWEQKQDKISDRMTHWLTSSDISTPTPTLTLRLKGLLQTTLHLGESNKNIAIIPNPDTETRHTEPWLVWEDLYNYSETVIPFIPKTPSDADAELSLEHFPQNYTEYSLKPPSNQELTVKETPTSSPEYTPDWIETESQPLGYVQHPLEKILKLFDEVVSKIENTVIKVWHFFTHWYK